MGNSYNIALNESIKKATLYWNVFQDDFIVKNGRRYYKTNCIGCGSDRGYKPLKHTQNTCLRCSNVGKYIRSNDQIHDFIERCKGSRKGTTQSKKTKIILSKKQKKYCKTYGNQFVLGKSKGKHSKETKVKLSHLNAGKAPKWKGRVFEYNGIKFRSSWEMKYAKFLDLNNVNWTYEPKYTLQDGRCFSPDFLLECGKIVEIKGFWTEKAKQKWALFCLLKPDIEKEVLYKKDLIQLGISI